MEHTRKQKLFIVVALFVAIASLSVGFAAFSTTLNISSSASVNPNSDNFKVKFSTNQNSLVVDDVKPYYNPSNLTTTNGKIDNSASPIISGLSVSFDTPGQYVEYSFYVRNEGEYTAYLNSINFVGEKVCEPVNAGDSVTINMQSACDSINVKVLIGDNIYSETTNITGHSLSKKTGELIEIELEYDSSGEYTDIPCKVTFPDIMMVYSTVDDPSIKPEPPKKNPTSATTLFSKVSKGALPDTNVDFSIEPETGTYISDETIDDDYPVFYYRGAVTNNNVLFANKCWKIVRTTETGGTKLIYNGTPTSDNQCNGDNSMLDDTKFNENYDSEDDVSYIYSDGTNSTVKQVVDTWYTSNMTAYTDMLEDTVWCNDRSVTYRGYYEDWKMDVTFFGAYARNVENKIPSLHCPAEYSLTTSATQVTNKLTYPVGLLTADELTLAGMGWNIYPEEGYLNNHDSWWTMSPCRFGVGLTFVFSGFVSGGQNYTNVSDKRGVRPAVSLKAGTVVATGNGTSSKPYVIE